MNIRLEESEVAKAMLARKVPEQNQIYYANEKKKKDEDCNESALWMKLIENSF